MKPILFTKENRDKNRRSAKTQTRRVITDDLPARARYGGHQDGSMWWEEVNAQGNAIEKFFQWTAPYVVGEIRYMCEPYVIHTHDYIKGRQVVGEYLDDGKPFDVVLTPAEWDRFLARKQPYSPTQARFMYRSLARTFVEITGLRREPLQEISESDAVAEGLDLPGCVAVFDAAANGLDSEEAYYVEDAEGEDDGNWYCYACAKKLAGENGQIGWGSTPESDGPAYCDECSKPLLMSLTAYGIERELYLEFNDLDNRPHYPASGLDARIAEMIADGIGDLQDRHKGRLAQIGFATLWNSINAQRGHPWESNPTVLVVEYKEVTGHDPKAL